MIISGLQTGNTRWLAAHLQNAADNETIELAEVSGTVATDIDGALAEFDAITAGTRAREGVYAAFINPPVPLSREQYMRAIALLEERLGLSGQPRIILFHTKNGREHCHIVWSRIDWRELKAIHLSHDRQKLRRCAQDLAAEFGTPLPPGLANDRGAERFKDPPQPTRAEKAMEAASGLAREDRRRVITDCYRNSDSAESFVSALEAAGFMLARGDKRVFVVIDIAGDVHALARQIDGAKTKDVKKKLEGLTLSLLPPVERAKVLMLQRAAALEDVRRADAKKAAVAEGERERLTAVQRKRRAALDLLWQQMKIRHMHEWKVLLAHIQAEKEHKIARRHWLAVGLAIYLRKIAFIRQLLEYYEERRKRTVEEQHRALMESVRLRHDNEAAELRRRYAALARLERREEWTYLQKFGEIADADKFGFARTYMPGLTITYESTYQYDHTLSAFRENGTDMGFIPLTDEIIDLHRELSATHGAEAVEAANTMSDFRSYVADEQWTMFRQNVADMTVPATTVRFI
ncbi:MAG: relaxase/mobilization nuclease domain-containing protein, partial [Hyphomicrobiales bacterium]|nr:relaxase/mobilization nuclease domain-containing protein [Hyphomicrobiales bacterium]